MLFRALIITVIFLTLPTLARAQNRETLCPAGYEALANNQAQNAITAFEHCLRQQFFDWPTEAELRTRLGAALLAEGRAEEALVTSNQIIALIDANDGDNGHPLIRRNRAAAYLQLGRNEDALNDLVLARSRNPDDGFSAALQGTALLRLDRYAEAVAAYDTALRNEPDYVAAWIGRSHAFLELDLIDDAINDAQEALGLAPRDPSALNGLCWALVQAQRAEEGLSICREASHSAPDNGSITHSLAAALEQVGELEEAYRLYARAYEQAPDVPLIAQDYARIFP